MNEHLQWYESRKMEFDSAIAKIRVEVIPELVKHTHYTAEFLNDVLNGYVKESGLDTFICDELSHNQIVSWFEGITYAGEWWDYYEFATADSLAGTELFEFYAYHLGLKDWKKSFEKHLNIIKGRVF